ncbi:MAG: YlxR family protein [Candidatus Gastranaerophilales bacterium]|nr:YlxR family protein [Candidatus Gastranaerophilales bacterium]
MKKNNNESQTAKEGSKKEPSLVRKCIGCSQKFERTALIRILKDHQTEEIIINPANKQFGRSCYICKNQECIKNALKKHKLGKFLKGNVPQYIIEQLKTICD